MSFDFTPSIAGLTRSAILRNHCIESLGSMTASVRSLRPTLLRKSFVSTNRPASSNAFATAFRATNRSMPLKAPPWAFNTAC